MLSSGNGLIDGSSKNILGKRIEEYVSLLAPGHNNKYSALLN